MLYTEYDSTRRMTLFSYIRRNIAEMHTYRYAYYNLVKNMLRTRYRRSALGFLWTLVNPLLNLTVIAVVFSIIFKMDMAVFGRYVFSGLTPWTFISTGLIQGTMSLVASEAFMKKVHLPKIMFPLVYISVEGINFLFSLISIYIIFLFIGAKLSWVMLLLPFAAIILFLFVAGCAMLLSVAYDNIQALVTEFITAFPYTIVRNEKNHGSNDTFERLTQETEGEHFAYCNQDDEWLPEKLTTLQSEMERTGSLLVCSDMYVIDGDGNVTADSITKVRRHHVFHSGKGLAEGLLFHNFITGCTMLVDAKTAKAAVPFCPYMIHDYYIALWCTEHRSIESVMQLLIRYRLHGANQTGVMCGTHDKKNYGEVRIEEPLKKLYWLKEHFPCSAHTGKTIDEDVLWLEARQSNWAHDGGARTVWNTGDSVQSRLYPNFFCPTCLTAY